MSSISVKVGATTFGIQAADTALVGQALTANQGAIALDVVTNTEVSLNGQSVTASQGSISVGAVLAPSWSTIPDPLPSGTELDMLQYLNDPGSVVLTTRAVGLTGGASYSSVTGTLSYGSSSVSGVSMEADYDDGQSAGGVVTSLSVVGTGASPMTFGHVFGRGDATDVSISGGQTNVKTRWDDGSVRMAVFSGSFTGGQSVDVLGTAPASGTNLTPAQLVSALGTTTITLSGGLTGSVNAADLISGATAPDGFGSLAWQDGPQCIERIVSKEIASGVYGKFYCAYYSSGQVRVAFCVDNSRAFDSAVQTFSNVTATFVLNGSQVWTDTLTVWRRTRFRKVFWASGGQLTPSPDLAYWDSTKAFPAYVKATTTATNPETIEPYEQGNIRSAQGSGGYHPQIGPHPEWDAICLRSGFTQSNFNAMVAHADALNGQCVLSGDIATGLPARLTQYPTANSRGWNNNGSLFEGDGEGQPSWQQASNTGLYSASHNPQAGALAYAVTGDFYHLETLWHYTNHSLMWTESSDTINNRGTDLEMRFDGEQARTHAWRLRDMAYSAFFGPDTGFALTTDFRTGIQSTVDYSYQQYVNPGPWDNSFGWPNSSNHPDPKPWQAYWVIASYMRIEEMDLYSGTNITAVNDFFATYIQHTTGNINDGWCWQYVNYGSDGGTAIPAQSGTDFSTSWADYYASSGGPVGCDLSGLYFGDGSTNVISYEANKLWAVSTAVDLGYITQADYDRQYDGWSAAGKANFANDPVWATVPR